jgi:hypothetical protein
MTEKERLERIREMERLFPGVLGNPVTFAGRWGLPLSKGYFNNAQTRRNGVNGKRSNEESTSSALLDYSPPGNAADRSLSSPEIGVFQLFIVLGVVYLACAVCLSA